MKPRRSSGKRRLEEVRALEEDLEERLVRELVAPLVGWVTHESEMVLEEQQGHEERLNQEELREKHQEELQEEEKHLEELLGT